jgi:dimethylargininase
VPDRAIVCPPSLNFADGITTAGLGTPNYARAIEHYEAYCGALERCGLRLIRLEADDRFPDSTFVEDTAVLTARGAILTRPGAQSRLDEVKEIGKALSTFYPKLHSIAAPGTLDGGDICEAEKHFFIGISERTNEDGARQLSQLLESFGYTTSLVDIRDLETPDGSASDMLHLKSGLAYLGDNRLALVEALANRGEFSGYELVRLNPGEEYAANCLRINDHVLVAAGYPGFQSRLEELDYLTTALDMSEFQKMDGGLSCLSLRF